MIVDRVCLPEHRRKSHQRDASTRRMRLRDSRECPPPQNGLTAAVVAVPNAPYDRDAVFLFAGRRKFSVTENIQYAYLVRIAKTYFRALPRVVASSIELTLRHDVVHNADDVPTKFRDFKRSGRWFSDPSATFLKPPVKHSPQRSTSLL